jgi:hypothetical protein
MDERSSQFGATERPILTADAGQESPDQTTLPIRVP